ncbi:hypothetical protein BDP81DRAFT_423538 [Colletotrichum phormii]|uniref:Uncharacterized protein n=1 Tax=Colletotrichum phormii TaxID=359342 RepID=A0AAJ0EGB3_9PEZI|nr:uncharacterized protein BDP81DRAFT_423538 [Colletotrichum phormii]KAK1639142.1 hypothetical protein BDP81DRAFT_423538 [Colletotrichum phormii]
MAQLTATTFSTDPALWIFTSLTAGNMHIVTATSRLETILRANRVPFKAIDLSTDDKARMLWGRRAGKDASGRPRKLPALIQEGLVLGDIVEIEEWNEYGELKQHVKIYYDEFTIPDINNKPKEIVKKKIIKKVPKGTLAAKAAAAASASESSSSAPAPPPAPPLPTDAASSAAAPVKEKPASTPKSPVESVSTASHQSIADEAAKRAKEIRLKSLREKVQAAADKRAEGEAAAATATASTPTSAEPEKKAEAEAAAETTTATPETPRKPSVASTSSGSSAQSAKPLGLQSPTTGSWGVAATTATNPDALRETLQSPTTARWKPSDVDKPVTVHMGAEVASASQEEIAAVEKAEAIKEEPSQENSDEEESEKKKKIAEVGKAEAIKEEPKTEEPKKEELKKEEESEKKKVAEVEKVGIIKEEPEKQAAEDTTKLDVAEKAAVPKEAAATEQTSAPAEEAKAAPAAEDDDEDEDDSENSSDDSEEDEDESESETKPKATEAKKEDAGPKAKETEIASRPKPAEPKDDGKPVGDA